MGYAVKEIFYTLQGEGVRTGRAAVFLRFTGCNLWSGRAADRGRGVGGCSAWCDTDFVGTNGPGGGRYEAARLVEAVAAAWAPRESERAARYVVCTGGEPLLQLDAPLVAGLKEAGFEVAIETNGTQPVPVGVDWVCVSPKAGTRCIITTGDELKLVFPQQDLSPEQFVSFNFKHHLLQPLDGLGGSRSCEPAVRYCLAHPTWRLSLQTHKWLGIP